MQQNPFQVAAQLEGTGQFRQARQLYRQLAGRHPGSAAAHAGIGRCAIAMNEYAEAERALQLALRVEPAATEYRTNLAYCYSCMGDVEAARKEARRALELDPFHAPALRVLAETYRTSGEVDRAYELIAPMVEKSGADPHMHVYLARLARTLGKIARARDILLAIDDAVLPASVRSAIHYELGTVYDALERYDDAWASFELANHLSPMTYDPASFSVHIDALIQVWTPERVEAMTRARHRTELPVFIVGMPRSGSSLLERILSASDAVAPGGERADIPVASRDLIYPEGVLHADAARIADRVDRVRVASLDRVARRIETDLRKVDARAQRVTDKNLSNYLYIPLILMLFPDATIIHTRRNPLDTCVSCYFQNFGAGMEFTNDLVTLGAHYRHYARLMTHWKRLFPGRIVELDYEGVVDDPEAESRRVVGEVGVPWSESCLRFHEQAATVVTMSTDQVRKPLYRSSVGRWKHYAHHLQPLREILEDAPLDER